MSDLAVSAARPERATRPAGIALAPALALLALAWLGAYALPLVLLLVLPLALGVPHVVNDLRLLLIRPPRAVGRDARTVVLTTGTALLLLRLATLFGSPHLPLVEVSVGTAMVCGAAATARGRRRAAVGLACAAICAPMWLAPGFAAVLLAHAHNVVAVVLWLVFLRERGSSGARGAVLASAIAAGVAALLLLPAGFHPQSLAGLSLDGLRGTLAPGLGPELGTRVVLSFAFAQAVHYAIWVVLLPAAAPHGEASGPRAWAADLGRTGLLAAAIAALAVPLLGLLEPTATRSGYLSLVLFHGWLELAVLAHWAAGSGDRTP